MVSCFYKLAYSLFIKQTLVELYNSLGDCICQVQVASNQTRYFKDLPAQP